MRRVPDFAGLEELLEIGVGNLATLDVDTSALDQPRELRPARRLGDVRADGAVDPAGWQQTTLETSKSGNKQNYVTFFLMIK